MNAFPKSSSNRQAILAIAAVVVLAVAVFSIIRQQTQTASSNQVWYYDLADGSLFPGEANQILPIAAPSGSDHGVLAHVFGCGSCTPESRKVLYLESNTPQAKQALLDMPDPTGDDDVMPYMIKAQEGQLIAAVPAPGEKPSWVSATSPTADNLLRASMSLCKKTDQRIRCLP